jgi:hypothetical protein
VSPAFADVGLLHPVVIEGKRRLRFLLLARIVDRIDEGDVSWSGELDLYDRFLILCPNKKNMLALPVPR